MKNILVFGGNSFIAKNFITLSKHKANYSIHTAGRSGGVDFKVDFLNENTINNFTLNKMYDAVLFCQGLNPSKNLSESSYQHFLDMYGVNIAGPSQILKNITRNLSNNCSVLFIGSIATKKGSYDPAYGASKSALTGLTASLTKAYPQFRFNILTLGLVEQSPVYKGMTTDFREKHANSMFGNQLIRVSNVVSLIDELIQNDNINNANIHLDGGYNS